jgi:D-sedoheptulose 7-phosphate isomerase
MNGTIDTAALRAEWEEHRSVAEDAAALLPTVAEMAGALIEAFGRGGKLIVFGNGGSAADAQHFAGELLGRFRDTRRPLPAVALSTDPSVVTCIANDFGYDDLFARQVEALAGPDDVVVGITTSGQSENVVRGLAAAASAGARTMAWTGADPGPAGAAAAMTLAVPSRTTARIQEMHTLAMHVICVAIDAWVARGAEAE